MPLDRQSIVAYENYVIERLVFARDDEGYDLSGIFVQIIIDECLEGGLIRGSFDFIDTINLIDSYVPNGSEVVVINMHTRDGNGDANKSFSKKFKITRYEDITDPSTQLRKFVRVHFVSAGEMTNEYIKISKSYKSVGTDFVVNEMLTAIGYEENLRNVEQTLYNKDLVIPNISPLEVINYMCSISQSAVQNNRADSNFYFYEDRDKVNFVSGMSLTQTDAVTVYSYGPTTSIGMYNQIVKFERARGYNLPDQLRNGGLGAMIHSHSLVDKKFQTHYMDFASAKVNYPKLNPIDCFSEDMLKEFSTRDTFVELRSEGHVYDSMNKGANGNASAIRAINRVSLSAKRAFAQVPACTDLTVGQVIDINTLDQNGNINIRDSGRWLINRLKHVITRETYFMNLELISDSNVSGGTL
ncbi:MAG: hypothetical protein ACRC3J_05665 [Culicoidibacterales bacterium]